MPLCAGKLYEFHTNIDTYDSVPWLTLYIYLKYPANTQMAGEICLKVDATGRTHQE